MSMLPKCRVAVIGCGFVGACHIDAIQRIGRCKLVAVMDTEEKVAARISAQYGVPCFDDLDALLTQVDVDAVHNCTPNFLHQQINEKVIDAGKHILCEKPLATNSRDAEKLLAKLDLNHSIVHAVNFNYRMYPMVQWMKQRAEFGALGRLLAVHGNYLQDHLLYETDYSWKVERAYTGPSRCVADIGSHWMDLAQQVTGARIAEVCADLATFHPVRKKTDARQVEQPVPIATEDYAAVLFRMDNGIHGSFCVSNSSAGRKNFLSVELDGADQSLYWNQETPNELWSGFKDKYNQKITRDPALLMGEALKSTRLPPGHPEGWADALRSNIDRFYEFILQGNRIGEHKCAFATFHDGLDIIRIVEAILQSRETGRWVRVSR